MAKGTMWDAKPHPIRVLHVLGGTDIGGTETWLNGVLQQVGRQRFSMDVLVYQNSPGALQASMRQTGATIHACGPARPRWRFVRRLRRLLLDNGPYQIVHSHVSLFSGCVLRAAHLAGVPVRIAHCHHAASQRRAGRINPIRDAYTATMRRWIARHATHRLAASHDARLALSLSPDDAQRWQVLRCGIDLAPFALPVDRNQLRRELDLDSQHYVLGHIGRMTEVKNQPLLLRMIRQLSQVRDDYHLLLVGDGPLRASLQRMATRLGVADRVRFLGARRDIVRLLAAMDQFVFPSFHEGLGLALVEAQAAGLPCVASSSIPREAILVPELVTCCRPDAPATVWAGAADRLRQSERSRLESASAAWQIVARSEFNLCESTGRLQDFYCQALQSVLPTDQAAATQREVAA